MGAAEADFEWLLECSAAARSTRALGIAKLMQYRISKPFIGYSEFIEISQERFEEAKLTILNLREVLSIEEKFNLILENYAEFERELLGLSLNHAMFSHQDWFSYQIEIHTINRRLINLLTVSSVCRSNPTKC